MAKRDKLYTVTKWNKPFFEEERRKKLYDEGGPFKYGVNTNRGGLVNSYYKTNWDNTESNYGSNNNIRSGLVDFNAYSNPSYWRDMITTQVLPSDQPSGGTSNSNP